MHSGDELQVLVGGVGLGYTAHAALASEGVDSVEVIELLPAAEREAWHRKLRAEVVKLQADDGSASDFLSGGYLEAGSTGFLAWILARGLPEEAGS